MGLFRVKEKLINKIKGNTFFMSRFGFESGIDITDDNMVLYRKNVVIKNIIFVSNIIYTLMFAFISFGDNSNWLLTILLFPVTFFVNYTLKKMINKGPDDRMSQTIAMYFAAFYMFLSSVIIYFKLKSGTQVFLQECGYILLYYSLAISAFYQDKKMLKNVFITLLILVTIIHFTVTYNILEITKTQSLFVFIKEFFKSNEFKDILVRTLLLGMYMLVMYIYVTMASYMQEERKKELSKRREVQEDFTNVVTKIFDVTIDSEKVIDEEDRKNVVILSLMARKLASLLSLPSSECDNVMEYARLHIDKKVNFDVHSFKTEDEKFEALRMQTELGSMLISRLQLIRKAESIVRSVLEGSDTPEFINTFRDLLSDTKAQIILICDLYVTLRSVKAYKKAFNHRNTMNYFETKYRMFFDPVVFDRFVKFSLDFEEIFDEN